MSESDFNPSRTVLIGDTSQDRFRLLERILRDDFHLQALRFANFNDLRVKAEINDDWLLVLIADDLHYETLQKGIAPHSYFIKLEDRAPLGCLVSGRQPPDMRGVSRPPHFIYVPRTPSQNDPAQRNQIIVGLQSFGFFPQQIHLPDLDFDPSERTLREQIRSLSKQRNLDEGKEILKHLIRWFFDSNNATIERLGQGLSGARVFLLQIKESAKTKSYVLKLTPEQNLWKLEEEVKKHERATEFTGTPPFRVHLPPLHPCHNQQSTYIARYKNWAAVCYDYLGDKKIGGIIDLETLLVCSLKELHNKTSGSKLHDRHFASGKPLTESRSDIFGGFLSWLCEEWCQANGKAERGMSQLWLTADCPPKKYTTLPPYQLKGKEKGQILNFLDSKDAEKVARLLPRWDEHREKVWAFVEKNGEPTGLAALDEPVSVILSPTHGDLNANNAMLWLEHADHPFLIDFPFFQESGHALQDFARLEVEIIYALTDNIEHCLDLIQRLRQKAEAVQARQDKPTDHCPGFFAEYLPALLYYTLREIGYPSRTVFKRLLAVYSASQILTQLDPLFATRHLI
jgi:hypothetical protein